MEVLPLGSPLFGSSVFIQGYSMVLICLMLELLGKQAAGFN